MYYIYMLRCVDDSLYTGITNNIENRMNDHFSQGKRCAKYTMSHKAKKLECVWQTEDKVLASKLEYRIKQLNKPSKEQLIINHKIEEVLPIDKIDYTKYKVIEVKYHYEG